MMSLTWLSVVKKRATESHMRSHSVTCYSMQVA